MKNTLVSIFTAAALALLATMQTAAAQEKPTSS